MKYGTLTTGVGVETIINLPFIPEYVQIGTIDTDIPLTKFEVTVGGVAIISISGQSLIQAFAKYLMKGMLGTSVKIASILKVADGFVGGRNCQISMTNAGATTPDIYCNSSNKGRRLFKAAPISVNASSSQLIEEFNALFFPSTNIDYVNIEFIDGHSEKFSLPELAGYAVQVMMTDANGLLAANYCIDNSLNQDIARIVIYTTSGGSATILKIAI